MKRFWLGWMVGLWLGGCVWAQEKLEYPGDGVLYLYRAELYQVVNGDTVALDLDLGFFVWLHKTRIRLQGVEAPGKTTEEGRHAIEWLTGKLKDATELGELRVKTYPAPQGAEVPWEGVVYASGENLNEAMVAAGLAKAVAR